MHIKLLLSNQTPEVLVQIAEMLSFFASSLIVLWFMFCQLTNSQCMREIFHKNVHNICTLYSMRYNSCNLFSSSIWFSFIVGLLVGLLRWSYRKGLMCFLNGGKKKPFISKVGLLDKVYKWLSNVSFQYMDMAIVIHEQNQKKKKSLYFFKKNSKFLR